MLFNLAIYGMIMTKGFQHGVRMIDLPVNLKKLRKKVADIRRAMDFLAPIANQSVKEYMNDSKGIAASKYYLIVAAEAAIDVCNHLAARLAKQAPDNYAECFQILAKGQIISSPLAERLIRMAKFRNLLVHQYADIDDEKVYDIICNDLKDLDIYLTELAALLKTEL